MIAVMGKLADEIELLLAGRAADEPLFPAFTTGELVTAERLNGAFEALGIALAAQHKAIVRLARAVDESRVEDACDLRGDGAG
jgi:hypothetical protein